MDNLEPSQAELRRAAWNDTGELGANGSYVYIPLLAFLILMFVAAAYGWQWPAWLFDVAWLAGVVFLAAGAGWVRGLRKGTRSEHSGTPVAESEKA